MTTDTNSESERSRKILEDFEEDLKLAATYNTLTEQQASRALAYKLAQHAFHQQLEAKTRAAEDAVLELANKFCGTCEDSYLTPIRDADGNITYFCLPCDGIPAMTTPNGLSKPYVNNKLYTQAEVEAKIAETRDNALHDAWMAVLGVTEGKPDRVRKCAYEIEKLRTRLTHTNNKKTAPLSGDASSGAAIDTVSEG